MSNKQAFPVLDDHIHLDIRNGRGITAAREFMQAGGTHICLVTKPSWSYNVYPVCGEDFSIVYNETLNIARQVEEIGVHVFPILGVHPAEIGPLTERLGLEGAVEVMKDGLKCAATYVSSGKAIAIKSGRPHYEVDEKTQESSNDILSYALELGGECDCAVQIHAETGPCADVMVMAQRAGMNPSRVVKHYGSPDTPLVPSLMAKHDGIVLLAKAGRYCTMESDFMDENSRPGAVLGPKSVPRFSKRYLESGVLTEKDLYHIHVKLPEYVYGVSIE